MTNQKVGFNITKLLPINYTMSSQETEQTIEQKVQERITQIESSNRSLESRLDNVKRVLDSKGQAIVPDYLMKVGDNKADELLKVAKLRVHGIKRLQIIVGPTLERQIEEAPKLTEAIEVYRSTGVISHEEMLSTLDSYQAPDPVLNSLVAKIEPISLNAAPHKTSTPPERPGGVDTIVKIPEIPVISAEPVVAEEEEMAPLVPISWESPSASWLPIFPNRLNSWAFRSPKLDVPFIADRITEVIFTEQVKVEIPTASEEGSATAEVTDLEVRVDLFEDFPLDMFKELDLVVAKVALEATRVGAVATKEVVFNAAQQAGFFPDFEELDNTADNVLLMSASKVGAALENSKLGIALKYKTLNKDEEESEENPRGFHFIRTQFVSEQSTEVSVPSNESALQQPDTEEQESLQDRSRRAAETVRPDLLSGAKQRIIEALKDEILTGNKDGGITMKEIASKSGQTEGGAYQTIRYLNSELAKQQGIIVASDGLRARTENRKAIYWLDFAPDQGEISEPSSSDSPSSGIRFKKLSREQLAELDEKEGKKNQAAS